MPKTIVRTLLLAWCVLVTSVAPAHSAAVPGIDYRELKQPQPTETRDAVEVIEFFWYRCPHCYALEPSLETWLAKLPAGVKFRRVPVIFGDQWAVDARILYALESIGELPRVHRQLLDAIHEQGGKKQQGAAYTKWVADWLAAHGVDAGRYATAFDSPAVQEQVKKASAMTQAYGVEGTPTFAVQGRYVVSPPPGDRRAILSITDQLIRLSQSQLARK